MLTWLALQRMLTCQCPLCDALQGKAAAKKAAGKAQAEEDDEDEGDEAGPSGEGQGCEGDRQTGYGELLNGKVGIERTGREARQGRQVRGEGVKMTGRPAMEGGSVRWAGGRLEDRRS